MNTNRKNIGILIIIIGLILIVVIIYLGFSRKRSSKTAVTTPIATNTKQLPSSLPPAVSNTNKSVSSTPQYDLSKETPHQLTADDLGKIAMAFSGRLGSFSNQSGYNNISNLEILMTDSMRAWAETYIVKLTKEYKNNGDFYNITTHPLLFKVNSFDNEAGKADITVTTQRQVRSETKPYQQKININFLRVKGKWLIDGAYWLK